MKMVNLYLEEKLKNELFSEAKKKGLSFNAYVRMLLIERNK